MGIMSLASRLRRGCNACNANRSGRMVSKNIVVHNVTYMPSILQHLKLLNYCAANSLAVILGAIATVPQLPSYLDEYAPVQWALATCAVLQGI